MMKYDLLGAPCVAVVQLLLGFGNGAARGRNRAARSGNGAARVGNGARWRLSERSVVLLLGRGGRAVICWVAVAS